MPGLVKVGVVSPRMATGELFDAHIAQAGEPETEIDPVNQFPGERHDKEVGAGSYESIKVLAWMP